MRIVRTKHNVPTACAALHRETCIVGVALWLRKNMQAHRHWRSYELNQERFDLLAILEYVLQRSLNRGSRHGRSVAQEEYFRAWQSYEKAIERNYKSIHDRFMNDKVFHASQLAARLLPPAGGLPFRALQLEQSPDAAVPRAHLFPCLLLAAGPRGRPKLSESLPRTVEQAFDALALRVTSFQSCCWRALHFFLCILRLALGCTLNLSAHPETPSLPREFAIALPQTSPSFACAINKKQKDLFERWMLSRKNTKRM